jgi:hypothetical protein
MPLDHLAIWHYSISKGLALDNSDFGIEGNDGGRNN